MVSIVEESSAFPLVSVSVAAAPGGSSVTLKSTGTGAFVSTPDTSTMFVMVVELVELMGTVMRTCEVRNSADCANTDWQTVARNKHVSAMAFRTSERLEGG